MIQTRKNKRQASYGLPWSLPYTVTSWKVTPRIEDAPSCTALIDVLGPLIPESPECKIFTPTQYSKISASPCLPLSFQVVAHEVSWQITFEGKTKYLPSFPSHPAATLVVLCTFSLSVLFCLSGCCGLNLVFIVISRDITSSIPATSPTLKVESDSTQLIFSKLNSFFFEIRFILFYIIQHEAELRGIIVHHKPVFSTLAQRYGLGMLLLFCFWNVSILEP